MPKGDAVRSYFGIVVENDDPLGLGRVQVSVPGLITASWAWPAGRMWGEQGGIHWVPEVDSNVIVQFIQGSINHPWYITGPFGAPEGTSDVPIQSLGGSPEHFVLRWRGFHVVIDGTPNASALTVKDESTGTAVTFDRQTGDMRRTVGGSDLVEAKKDQISDMDGERSTTIKLDDKLVVEEGDREATIAVGSDSRTVGGDSTETIGGSESKTTAINSTEVVTGDRTETFGKLDVEVISSRAAIIGIDDSVEVGGSRSAEIAGNDSEDVVGSKTVEAGLNVSIVAGGNATIQAVGNVLVQGGNVTVTADTNLMVSAAGVPPLSTYSQAVIPGVVTETILGAFVQTILGAYTAQVDGVTTINYNGVASFLGTLFNLGVPPFKKFVTEDVFSLWANIHSHKSAAPGVDTTPPNQKVILGAQPPDVELDDVTTQNVKGS